MHAFLVSGVKLPVCEVNHSPTTSAEVKNEWSYTSTLPIWLHGVDIENFSSHAFPESSIQLTYLAHRFTPYFRAIKLFVNLDEIYEVFVM